VISSLNPDDRGRVDRLEDEIPIPANPPSGRALRTRCPMAREAGWRGIRLHTVAPSDHLVQFYVGEGFAILHHGPRPLGDDGFDRAFLCKTIETGEPAA